MDMVVEVLTAAEGIDGIVNSSSCTVLSPCPIHDGKMSIESTRKKATE